ncbi:MAG: Gfo/Idh/MocA family oxidoreductase [Clostridia bacterium]|nr:Gfo/Idh/MocA family oxidoreductase [Clostridia bacterium]MBO7658131.1 Gfo/Idh/MocA family oxidoreductase [Clostridia bacterium]MBP5665166.1 Gfo/Idh/MocA family oxidoreductase [Clostridia bacterium]MBP5765959.1 Gfo/Idh/MocA family oxidoreductase [Clostridia bacterium]
MKTLRVGIIGVGNIGTAHCGCIANGRIKGMTLAALCDIDPEKRRILAGKYPVPFFEDGDELIKSGLVDAIIVATPHRFHPHYCETALKNGIHALSEKPAGVNVSEVKLLNKVAEASGAKFGIMFNQRTDGLFRKAKEIIEAGGIGEPKRLVWIVTNWYRTQSYYNSGSWRATWNGEGGGVLLNQAPHNIDLWQWLFGIPSRIRAFCGEGKYHRIAVEDEATIYAEYANGATAVFITTTGEAPGTNRLEISGDRGKIVLEKSTLTYTSLMTPEREFCFTCEKGAALPPMTETSYIIPQGRDGHELILENFAAAVLEDAPLIAPGTEGIRELSISNAAFLSSWTDSWVNLPLSDEDCAGFDRILEEKRKAEKAVEEAAGGEKTAGNKGEAGKSTGKERYISRWNVKW